MEEIVIVVVVIGALLLMIDQIRKLIGHFVLNRTIGKALDKAPETVPLLIAKIEDPKPWPISPFGWFALVLGLAFGLTLALSETASSDEIGIAAGMSLFGALLLVSHHRNATRSSSEIEQRTDLID